jgi:hypothetical protein
VPAFMRARQHARALQQQMTQPTLLRSFDVQDPVLSPNLVVTNKAWFIDCPAHQVVPLFEVPNPEAEQGRLIYRAQLKTEGLQGRAYLEMWCRLPGNGLFFSRGLNDSVSGSTGWNTYETPFLLQRGQRPDLVKLNVVVEGAGQVWIRDVQLLNSP